MANTLESELSYPFGDTLPAQGRSLPVADGVRWLRMRLPFALDHINLWLLRDRQDGRDGWTVVDCGIDDAPTRAAWEQVFADELQGLPVLRVICTHMHPDHIGLAHWITERWSCRLWISATDWNAARVASSAIGDAHSGDSAADFYAQHGLDDAVALERMRRRSNVYASMVRQVPVRFRRLMDGVDPALVDTAEAALAALPGVAPDVVLTDMTTGRASTPTATTARAARCTAACPRARSAARAGSGPATTP